MIRRFRMALAFLTRLRGGLHPESADEISSSVAFFPVVGALVGGVGALVAVGSVLFLPALTAASLAFIATALTTGGFHEDGLADSFDGLAGGWSVEQRLEILKDSRHGTFGVLSILLVTVVKVTALAEVLESTSWWRASLVVIGTHAGARGAAVVLMGAAPTASHTGLGADYTRMLGASAAITGGALGVLLLIPGFLEWTPVAVVVTAVLVAVVGVWAKRKIGGITGDLLGAAEQVAECTLLCVAAAAFA